MPAFNMSTPPPRFSDVDILRWRAYIKGYLAAEPSELQRVETALGEEGIIRAVVDDEEWVAFNDNHSLFCLTVSSL